MKEDNLSRKVSELINLLEEIREENIKLKNEIWKKEETLKVLRKKLETIESKVREVIKKIESYIDLIESGKI
ncbi:MAG: hypothetical protein ACPLSJ_01065 [Thermosulfidibacteraceae bacterium]|jgi:DNA-binding protein H-NS